jgi:hypothetical protein
MGNAFATQSNGCQARIFVCEKGMQKRGVNPLKSLSAIRHPDRQIGREPE